MKYPERGWINVQGASRPARGGWIEIRPAAPLCPETASRPARGGWIEISGIPTPAPPADMSRPARGGWIEICT